ncbi:uroporphyrinogen-III synthase [Kushneria indalinina]|uniref:Uroporphyrinogen-III synthase n=1 Tax=Kushneria indalinina DSM 14324 TaxID=1122140 RepID=A0A3D9DSI2_9GAMM|nr:uroporphyrinogen-III synthase [Kushneria indalinina]REC93641.1 uroporphyrinogen-III synthase [Kushneria indalinina DSM 14324]
MSLSRPTHGPTALIARPGARAQALEQALEQVGLAPRSLNIMTLVARVLTPRERTLLYDLDNFRHIICTSPFAAACLIEAIEARWPQLPEGISFHATGISTASVLEAGLGVDVSAPASGSGSASEALLALPGLQAVNGARIALVSGEGGRELIEQTLFERGAEVSRLSLYERQLQPPEAEAAALLERGDFALLIVTSQEQLEYLNQWCTPASRRRPLVVSSQRLATMAGRDHFECVFIAGDATPQTLAETSAVAWQQAPGIPD